MKDENNIVTVEEKNLPTMAAPHMRLIEIAVQKGADIAQLEKLMDLQDRYDAKEARKSFFSAFSGFQSDLPEIGKTGKVGYANKDGSFTGYKHSTLADIGRAVAPILSKYGLSYRFEQLPRTDPKDQSITLVCILSHKDGHEERTQMTGFADTSGKKNAIQAIASTRTYMQRYTLTDALGLTFVEEDDDGIGGAAPVEQNSDNQQEQTHKFYDDETFNKNFPAWESAIKSGKRTPEAIVAIINKNNIQLSDQQLNKIYGVQA